MGDLKNGRTIHSLLQIFKKFNVKINLVSPDNLTAPFKYAQGININFSLNIFHHVTKIAGDSVLVFEK